jgi:thiosulfate/3-mercaptopyruvate sulfurtransferase
MSFEEAEMTNYARAELLVDADWLQAHLEDPNLRIVDCDPPDAYRRVHIPGAVSPKDNYLKNPDDRRFIMTPEQFAAEMTRLGIGDETDVVAYDAGSTTAGRLWWCLNYYGHTRVRVLNGGWNLWLKQGRPVTMAVPEVAAPGAFTARADESMYATAEQIMANLEKPEVVVLDVRSDGEWEGTNARGNKRAGHIPGAVHLEWTNNLTPDDEKRWKSADELREMYAACGITPDKQIVTV